MDLYTMNENFLAQDEIDEYVSAIWTERYTAAGDCQLVVPASNRMIHALAEGTYMGLRGSKEVMQLKTQSIENGLLTVLGKSLIEYLDERWVWFMNPDSSADSPVAPYEDKTRKPGELISYVVDKVAINPTNFTAPRTPAGLQAALEKIPNLSLGNVDHSGEVSLMAIPTGPLYTGIQPLAEQKSVGISLYLNSASVETGYTLKFATYQGVDHTSDQTAVPLIRLAPNLETLSGIKELNSIDGYKNVVYVLYQGQMTVHYEDPDNIPEGLQRRVLIVEATGAPVATGKYVAGRNFSGSTYTQTYTTPADIAAFREQQAKNALANHNHIHAVDGQTQPADDFVYGVDFGLGDVIELQSFTGKISKARITEFIRSDDAQGERSYPTISVINNVAETTAVDTP